MDDLSVKERRTPSIVLKYAVDRVSSILLLVLLFPLFVVVAIAIKLDDDGPIFFCQDRLGLGGRRFRIWKFRSMVSNADELLSTEKSAGESARITRVGRFIRSASIDELPQLINILRGEMSCIGPRPVLPTHWDRLTNRQRERFAVRPGVTGLAQVNGRNSSAWSKRIDNDLEYVNGYSLWLDLKIIFRTIKVVLFGEGFVMDRNPEQVDDLKSPEITTHRLERIDS